MLITAFGVVSAGLMVVAYGLESRGSIWVLIFAGACASTAIYGAITGAWIFAVLETVWAGLALRRFASTR